MAVGEVLDEADGFIYVEASVRVDLVHVHREKIDRCSLRELGRIGDVHGGVGEASLLQQPKSCGVCCSRAT